MEVHELGLYLARVTRNDLDWIPWDAHYHLLLIDIDTPALAMTYKISKKTNGWLNYSFIHTPYGWHRTRRKL